jgi:hypothetical protein
MALYGAETWILRKRDQICLENLKICCWRKIEKIGWADYVRKGVLNRVK